MKDLKQLISITSRKRIGKIDILQSPLPSHSMQSKMYSIVNETDVLDEDKIAAKLYGKNANHSNNRFVKLKSRLKQKLLNTILFIEPTDKFLKLKSHSYKQLYFGKVLQFLGSYGLAAKILKKAIGVAVKIELYDVAYDATFQLLSIATLNGDKTEFTKTNTELNKYEHLRDLQLKTKRKYYELTLYLNDSKVDNNQRIALLESAIRDISKPSFRKQHYSLNELFYRLKIVKYKIEKDYTNLLKTCLKAINELNDNEYFPSESYFHFKYAALDTYYKLNKYKEGISFIEKANIGNKFKPIGYNLHLVKKYEVLYSFGELNFEDAYQNIIEFMSSRAFNNQSELVKESWKLYHAYAEWGLKTYSRSLGIISIHKSTNKQQSKFRLYKFLNEVPQLTKDKTGFNVALLIIQYLHHLSEGDYGEILQKSDAIKVYKSRYLKDPVYKRANVFISMLLRMEKYSFNVNETSLNCAENHQYLKTNPDSLTIEDYEVIPFHKLWQISLRIMKKGDLLAKAI